MISQLEASSQVPAGNPGIVPPWLRGDDARILPVPRPASDRSSAPATPEFLLPAQLLAELQGIVDALEAAGIQGLRLH